MTRVLALAGQSKIGCITQRRFAKAGTKTHSQRGAALDRNGLSVSTETACRFEPKLPVGNSEICTHPVVPGSPICGMRMPCGGRLRRAQEGIEWLASNRCVDSPARAKGPRNCHRHADKQLKSTRKTEPQPRFRFHPPA